VRRLQISSDVRDAINAPEQFRVAFQPLVRLSDWKTIGYEALVRWQHPREGLIQPDLFIPAAEETGVIVRLGREVLVRSLERLAREQREDPTLTMHVNVSVQEIMHGDLPEHVFAAIKAAGVRPETVTLEITENTIIDTSTGAGAVLERLRAGGVRICVDDFGIGYSSLRYLSLFPINSLKIDRSFVSGTGEGIASEPICRMLLDLARSLDLTVVAEGIETPEQADRLLALGAVCGQGYIFSRPIIPERDGELILPDILLNGRPMKIPA
jgi:EAL domain-containing protein (putative c-di-GMP-specific phosphodiesterase class I)